MLRREHAVELQAVGAIVRQRDEHDVEQDLGEPALVEQVPGQQRARFHPADLLGRASLDPPQVRGEQAHRDEEGRAQEQSETVIQPRQHDRHHAARGRERIQQQRHLTLAQPEGNEAIGAVVQAALRDRPPREHARDRDERRVEQRHRHDRQRDEQHRD